MAAAAVSGIAPVEVLAVPDVDVSALAPDDPRIHRVEPALLAEATQLAHPPRVVALFRSADLPAAADRRLTVALHGVADPGNVGAIIRSVDALGPGVVRLEDGCADPLSPAAVRASMGAIFAVPVERSAPVIPGARHVALTADGTIDLADVDLAGSIVFHLGGERAGVPEATLRTADVVARIPQAGAVGSLNVAAAAAIALYALSVRRAGSTRG